MVVMIDMFVTGIAWITTMIGEELKGVVDELRPEVSVDLVAEVSATVAIAVGPGHRVVAIVAHQVEAEVLFLMGHPEDCQRVSANPGVVVIAGVTVRRLILVGALQVLSNL
jgi:hypothetical protein